MRQDFCSSFASERLKLNVTNGSAWLPKSPVCGGHRDFYTPSDIPHASESTRLAPFYELEEANPEMWWGPKTKSLWQFCYRVILRYGGCFHSPRCYPFIYVFLFSSLKKMAAKKVSWLALKRSCCCQVASVVSDSVQPHRRQPTRLVRPWDSPGKNTGVGCHFLLQNCLAIKQVFFPLRRSASEAGGSMLWRAMDRRSKRQTQTNWNHVKNDPWDIPQQTEEPGGLVEAWHLNVKVGTFSRGPTGSLFPQMKRVSWPSEL